MQQSIAAVLSLAAKQLSVATDVPQLEAEVLLSHVLNVSRTYLHAWSEKCLDDSQQRLFIELVARRVQGEPIAYIIGHREFWSLDLIVTPDVLIPRPETELLVELVLSSLSADISDKNTPKIIADLGTGSGAIALAIAHERPHWVIHATDASAAALDIAKLNAKRLNIQNIIFHQGEWCGALPNVKFDAIVSNPPYIAEDDAHLSQGDLRYEPICALAAPEDGLKDIQNIIHQAHNYLLPKGLLLLEHGYQQGKKIASFFEKEGYTSPDIYCDLAGQPRVTIATWVGF